VDGDYSSVKRTSTQCLWCGCWFAEQHVWLQHE